MLAVPDVLGNRDLDRLFSSALLQASEKDYLLHSIILTNAKIGDERLWSRLFPGTPAWNPSVSFNHELCFVDSLIINVLRTISNKAHGQIDSPRRRGLGWLLERKPPKTQSASKRQTIRYPSYLHCRRRCLDSRLHAIPCWSLWFQGRSLL